MSSPETKESSKRKILRRMFNVYPSTISREEAERQIKEKLTEDIIKTTEGKSQSWLEKQRVNLNNAWKKTKHETRSMFCAKGKHERCTFDPECSCPLCVGLGVHPKTVVI